MGTIDAPPPPSNADPFAHRAGGYADANRSTPDARAAERDRLFSPLALCPGMRVVDLQSASGYVAEGVAERLGSRARVICVEPSAALVRTLRGRFDAVHAELCSLPFESASMDAALCLAGTHHSPHLQEIAAEAARILRPGSPLSIAEVERGSAVDRWLDGFVDCWNPDGHRGFYVDAGELSAALRAAGFSSVREERVEVPWRFKSGAAMAEFCRVLFGLRGVSASRVEGALRDTLPIRETDAGIELGWSLRFATGLRR